MPASVVAHLLTYYYTKSLMTRAHVHFLRPRLWILLFIRVNHAI